MDKQTTKNIIKSWREYLDFKGITLQEGVYRMNAMLRTRIIYTHINEFEKGTRNIPVKVQNYLCDEVFEYALISCELRRCSLENLKTFQSMMRNPERK